MTENAEWPNRPAEFPAVMTDVEACMYLRLDADHGPASAKETLRHIRRTRGLPCVGRIGGKVLFRRVAIDAWLAAQEAAAVGLDAAAGAL